MGLRSSISATAVMLAVAVVTVASAPAAEDIRYPDWQGAWSRWAPPNAARDQGNGGTLLTAGGQPSFDQTKPWGRGQEAPLTPEYQAILDASIADQEQGGFGNSSDHVLCRGAGMPFMMVAFRPLEFVITPRTTYVLIADYDALRRIFTDGRDWPAEIEPTLQGYSIGKWVDEDGDGKFDVLEVETRGFKGNRVYDISGIPLHRDNQSVFKERIFLDKDNHDILHDVITVFDHALTRPWTVDKRYVREADPNVQWPEFICNEYNAQVMIGGEHYYLSGEGLLMPTRKNQPPPDLRYFQKMWN
jgi:hypothetical protein